jgi:RimJ/RimL family protein N-acetyltransferase
MTSHGGSALDGIALTPLATDHLDEVHAIQSDPRTWEHHPAGRPTDIAATERMIAMSQHSWTEHGFGLWTVRLEDGMVAGTCGALVPALPFWNLGYRLSPAAWGRGLASALARKAAGAARTADPMLPLVARVLATNPASTRVAENAGLTLVWSGPSKEGPARLLLADRELSPTLLDSLIALG